eukprot:tig00000113_g5605.t1
MAPASFFVANIDNSAPLKSVPDGQSSACKANFIRQAVSSETAADTIFGLTELNAKTQARQIAEQFELGHGDYDFGGHDISMYMVPRRFTSLDSYVASKEGKYIMVPLLDSLSDFVFLVAVVHFPHKKKRTAGSDGSDGLCRAEERAMRARLQASNPGRRVYSFVIGDFNRTAAVLRRDVGWGPEWSFAVERDDKIDNVVSRGPAGAARMVSAAFDGTTRFTHEPLLVVFELIASPEAPLPAPPAAVAPALSEKKEKEKKEVEGAPVQPPGPGAKTRAGAAAPRKAAAGGGAAAARAKRVAPLEAPAAPTKAAAGAGAAAARARRVSPAEAPAAPAQPPVPHPRRNPHPRGEAGGSGAACSRRQGEAGTPRGAAAAPAPPAPAAKAQAQARAKPGAAPRAPAGRRVPASAN